MESIKASLTVFFENPFWVAVIEREVDGKYAICKVPFGSEPKDHEVYAYFLKNYSHLKFSPPVSTVRRKEKRFNPKRMQREINKQMQKRVIGTKAQQALKLQQEQNKKKRKTRSREMLEAEKERQFELHRQKRREKHKGH